MILRKARQSALFSRARSCETATSVTHSIPSLRRFAVARNFGALTSLEQVVDTLGFVQADPIRAPAPAQDLTLRHRVAGYREGDIEQAYPGLDLEEDTFINYGYVTRRVYGLMHPRSVTRAWTRRQKHLAEAVLAFVRTQ